MLRKKVDHSMNHKSLESRSINKKEISKKKRISRRCFGFFLTFGDKQVVPTVYNPFKIYKNSISQNKFFSSQSYHFPTIIYIQKIFNSCMSDVSDQLFLRRHLHAVLLFLLQSCVSAVQYYVGDI